MKITPMEIVTTAVIVLDWGQSRDITQRDDIYEKNKHLGPYPSRSEVNEYFIARIISNSILHRVLPEKYLLVYQVYTVADHGMAVIENHQLGLTVDF